jgi:hypothetical protein
MKVLKDLINPEVVKVTYPGLFQNGFGKISYNMTAIGRRD